MSKNFNKTFIFKIVNTFAGSRKDLMLSLIVTIVFGALYSFRLWDIVLILIVFGITLPLLYTIGLYKFLIHKNLFNNSNKIFSFAETKPGNNIFLLIDILILITTGILIILDIIDFVFFRFLLTIILPVFYLLSLHGLINGLYSDVNEDNGQ